MEAPSLPEGLQEELKTVRDSFHLRWNPRAKVAKAGHIDAYGVLSPAKYDGRWELWDIDPDGLEYKVMSVQDENGNYRQPDRWLIDLLNQINPANFGGSVVKMVAEFIDKPNRTTAEMADEDFEDLIDQIAKWAIWANTPKQRVTADIR